METEEVIKFVDNIYKNILDKFNPGARQLISAGKVYLKALHGAAAASQVFNEALSKIAENAQQGGTNDIGSALLNIVDVYKDIQDQHMNILKAFYVDLLVPLETNLEKDTKVVQFEQKKFLQQHKIRADSYSKATATMKKQRKKKSNAQNTEKEMKSIQAVDEEKNKLDAFCEQSLKNAMTQERRRYGFVLERQCSLAKHWIAYHSAGKNFILNNLENWEEVSASREFLPPNMENVLARHIIMNAQQQQHDGNHTDGENESERSSVISAMRKTRSIDASCLDMRSIGDVVSRAAASNMPRAKSEFNLTSAAATVIDAPKWDQRTISRGLYAYLSSGENQLSFLEGDRIALVGDRAKGWQFGENLRTHTFGWFPVAYTELEHAKMLNNWGASQLEPQQQQQLRQLQQQQQQQQQPQQTHQHYHQNHARSHSKNHQHNDNNNADNSNVTKSHQQQLQQLETNTPDSSIEISALDEVAIPSQAQQMAYHHEDASPARMFGDTIMYRESKQYHRVSAGVMTNSGAGPKPGPPPTLPAPVPKPEVPISYPSTSTKSKPIETVATKGSSGIGEGKATQALNKADVAGKQVGVADKRNGHIAVNNVSLHSSNDSGFANELAPPQPDIDYSDDEAVHRVPISQSTSSTLVANAKKSSRIPTRRVRDANTHGNIATINAVQQSKSSSTLSRPAKKPLKSNSNTMRSATSYGNLTLAEQKKQLQQNTDFVYRTIDRKSQRSASSNGNIIKRTKSFWKFGKNDDILEGMAMWRHRDLVPIAHAFDFEQDDSDIASKAEAAGEDDDTTVASFRRDSEFVEPSLVVSQQNEFQNDSEQHNENQQAANGNKISRAELKGNYVAQQDSNNVLTDKPTTAGNMYHFTKSDIDNRISAIQQQTATVQQSPNRHENHPQLRTIVTYETALDKQQQQDNESIYDVQPKTRQMGEFRSAPEVMSRDKVLRQVRQESELEIQEIQQQQQQQQQQHRTSGKYGNAPQQQRNSSHGQTQTQSTNHAPKPVGPNIPLVASSSSKKKKKTTNNISSKSKHQQQQPQHQQQQPQHIANHAEYYTRTETPDTIQHDDNNGLLNDNAVRMHDTNFYDDESADDVAIMMKTVKRQDILKQYYNSSDDEDTEQNSTSSDAYDCIVVEDHQVTRRSHHGQQQQQQQQQHQQQQLSQLPPHNSFVGHADVGADGPKSPNADFKRFRGGSDDKDSGMESSRPGTLLPRTKLSKGTAAVAESRPNGERGSRSDRVTSTTAERSSGRALRHEHSSKTNENMEQSQSRRDPNIGNHSAKYQAHNRQQQHDLAARENMYRSSDVESSVKSYGPWYDLWGK